MARALTHDERVLAGADAAYGVIGLSLIDAGGDHTGQGLQRGGRSGIIGRDAIRGEIHVEHRFSSFLPLHGLVGRRSRSGARTRAPGRACATYARELRHRRAVLPHVD